MQLLCPWKIGMCVQVCFCNISSKILIQRQFPYVCILYLLNFFLTKSVFSRLAPGHFGFIKLPVSVYHPSHVGELTKILNMICFSCLQFKNTLISFFFKFCISLLPGSPTTTCCKSREDQWSHKLGTESASQGRTGRRILEFPRWIWLSNKGNLSLPPFIPRRGTSTRQRLIPPAAKASILFFCFLGSENNDKDPSRNKKATCC